jgi:hypothetical protein
MMVGNYFVTPHAVRQFQQRIVPLPYQHALAVILRGLAQDLPIKYTQSGQHYVRVKRPYSFRAVIDGRKTTAEKPSPAVVTILKG